MSLEAMLNKADVLESVETVILQCTWESASLAFIRLSWRGRLESLFGLLVMLRDSLVS